MNKNQIIALLTLWCGLFTIVIGELLLFVKPEIIIAKSEMMGIILIVVAAALILSSIVQIRR